MGYFTFLAISQNRMASWCRVVLHREAVQKKLHLCYGVICPPALTWNESTPFDDVVLLPPGTMLTE